MAKSTHVQFWYQETESFQIEIFLESLAHLNWKVREECHLCMSDGSDTACNKQHFIDSLQQKSSQSRGGWITVDTEQDGSHQILIEPNSNSINIIFSDMLPTHPTWPKQIDTNYILETLNKIQNRSNIEISNISLELRD